ncbi:MAG: ferrous iron transport protein A [Planctomycetaceae bacterium]|nr:ferrous iron transport protein A [Planctomycetaceae bacterium]
MSQVIPLELLQVGEQGCIQCVDGCEHLTHRLAEMGLREGVSVRMIRPGCPCLIAVDNQRLSLRIEGSACVLVEVLDRQAP